MLPDYQDRKRYSAHLNFLIFVQVIGGPRHSNAAGRRPQPVPVPVVDRGGQAGALLPLAPPDRPILPLATPHRPQHAQTRGGAACQAAAHCHHLPQTRHYQQVDMEN